MKNKKSGGIGGIGFGFLLIIGGICLLWWNEGRTVKTEASIKEVQSSGIEVNDAKYNSDNNDKIVLVTGKTQYETVTDTLLNITVEGLVLNRKVEVYEWEESCDDDNCTYKKIWSDDLIDSSNFRNSSYKNPTSLMYKSEMFYTSYAKLGDFNLSKEFLAQLDTNDTMPPKEDVEIEGFHVQGSYYTNVKNEADPEIGDLRIIYLYNDANEVTALGVQKEKELATFVGKSGYSLNYVREGIYTLPQVINSLRSSNKTTKWLLRGLGILLVIIGISSVLSPITKLLGYIPILGSIANGAIGIVTFAVGLAISLVVIAVAWFRYRPLLSIGLIVAVVALIILIKKFTKKKEA